MQPPTGNEFAAEAHRRAALVREARDLLLKCVNGITTGCCEAELGHAIMTLQAIYERLLDANGSEPEEAKS